MVFKYKILVLFLILNLNPDFSYSRNKIDFRFKEIKINNFSNNYEVFFSKKLKNFLSDFFSNKGDLEKYKLEISIKRYNISLSKLKKNNNKLINLNNSKKFKILSHNIVVNGKILDNSKLITDFVLNITEDKLINELYTHNEKKIMNKKLFSKIKENIDIKLRKVLLLKAGDFIIPN